MAITDRGMFLNFWNAVFSSTLNIQVAKKYIRATSYMYKNHSFLKKNGYPCSLLNLDTDTSSSLSCGVHEALGENSLLSCQEFITLKILILYFTLK